MADPIRLHEVNGVALGIANLTAVMGGSYGDVGCLSGQSPDDIRLAFITVLAVCKAVAEVTGPETFLEAARRVGLRAQGGS